MALEQVFKCPRTLNKLRSGPLSKFMEGFCRWLLSNGFSISCIRVHLVNASHFNSYLGGPTAGARDFITYDDVDEFLDAHPSWSRHRGALERHLHSVTHSIHRFVTYLQRENRFRDAVSVAPIYQPLMKAYLAWLRDHQHAAPGTVEVRRHSIKQFFLWLGPRATEDRLSSLTADEVERFFLAYAESSGPGARRSMQAALRLFFRFSFQQGSIRLLLDQAVPAIRTYKLSTVPRGLTEAQALKILQAVDRHTDAGRRDYAILQMLYTFGVRGGQIRALQLDDIQWSENRILFKALKHGKDSLLPLTMDVGESLLDYLRNVRPRCAYSEVFLTCRAPYRPLSRSSTISEIVARCFRRADIKLPSQGACTFRHGFATRMIEQGWSLKAVADVLGHRYQETTFIYTKVDFNALEQVALPWPEENRT